MSTTIMREWMDHDRDGTFDDVYSTIKGFDAITGWQLFETRTVEDLHGGMMTIDMHNYAYDAAGRKVSDANWIDRYGGGVMEYNGTTSYTYDAAGRLANEVLVSPDFDGDGNEGDYRTDTTYSYDAAGRITAKLANSFAYGAQNPGDYVSETWSYDAAGRLAQYQIDDPNFYDDVITNYYRYNRAGLLQDIKIQDEIRFGDDRPRIDESWTYNKDGTMKTHTSWADYSDKGWFQRVDTAFTWRQGYDSQKVTYDLQGDFDPEAIKLVENWYNADGHLTHTLTSHDDGGDGGPLAGGFDHRDLFVKTWQGDVMVAETRDFGLDGTIDYQMTFETLLA